MLTLQLICELVKCIAVNTFKHICQSENYEIRGRVEIRLNCVTVAAVRVVRPPGRG